MKKLLNILYHAIFWIWNLTFITVVYAGILPNVGQFLFAAALTGELPLGFLISLLGLMGVPVVCSLLGWFRFRKQPLQLIRLFYGVEAPLFLLCLIRLFVLRETTPASSQILLTLAICMVAFGVELACGYLMRDRTEMTGGQRAIAYLQLACHSLMLIMSWYTGILLLFYAIPVAWISLVAFFSFGWVQTLGDIIFNDLIRDIWSFWWLPIGFLLFGFSVALFVAMPPMVTFLYIQSWRRITRSFIAQFGRKQALLGSVGLVTAWIVIFVALQQQPQTQALALLSKTPATDRDRQALLEQSPTIRSGLLNAYLSPYRYLGNRKDVNHIELMYSGVFSLPKEAAQAVQGFYNQVMSPFLYNGDAADSEKAAKLYAQFFDTSIQKAEQPTINEALESTWNRDEAKAGLLNLNQKKVWLKEQKVSVKPQGDWAEVELYEVYENQTTNLQEVFYSFSLPESAVITGVWLGNTGDRDQRYPYIVSPRGAAQKVYNEQVRERIDPALLEQVGPRHYRLRAFPIPAKASADQQLGWRSRPPEQPTQLHLWMTYKVMQQPQGWALPELAEKRNVFWTDKTQRMINGQPVSGQKSAQTDWLPTFIAAAKPVPTTHQVTLAGGDQIIAKPLNPSDYVLPQGKRFAVVLDSSRSMGAHKQQIQETFQWLQANGLTDSELANNDADLYIPTFNSAKPQRLDDLQKFDPAQMTFYGSLQLKEMIQQFDRLRKDTRYDGVLLVSDEGSYELADDKQDLPAMTAPLWIVHLGGMPIAYDDATLKAMQDSNGGVATSLAEALQRMATQAKLGASVISVADGYAWYWEKATPANSQANSQNPAPTKTSVATRKEFGPIAARQFAVAKSRTLNQANTTDRIAQLDAIHAIAKTYDIVTPYSSMIVLINDEQRAALKKAEAQRDRFERKIESGEETLTKPFSPLTVSAVPEPAEWLLFTVGAIVFAAIARRRWKQQQSEISSKF